MEQLDRDRHRPPRAARREHPRRHAGDRRYVRAFPATRERWSRKCHRTRLRSAPAFKSKTSSSASTARGCATPARCATRSACLPPGESVAVGLIRDGREQTVTAVLGELAPAAAADGGASARGSSRARCRVRGRRDRRQLEPERRRRACSSRASTRRARPPSAACVPATSSRRSIACGSERWPKRCRSWRTPAPSSSRFSAAIEVCSS